MDNRTLEFKILKEIENILKTDKGLIPFQDITADMKLPGKRIICKVNSSNVVARYEKSAIIKEKKEYPQVNELENDIVISFINSNEEANKVFNYFSHMRGQSWYQSFNGTDFVISEISNLKDMTEYTEGGNLKRLVLEITVTTWEEIKAEIEIVKKVDFKVNFIKMR